MSSYLYHDNTISIDSMCLESYPCQHKVCYGNKCYVMSATNIIKLFRELRKPIPEHFWYAINTKLPKKHHDIF